MNQDLQQIDTTQTDKKLQVKLKTAAAMCDMSLRHFKDCCKRYPELNPYKIGDEGHVNYLRLEEVHAFIEKQKVINSSYKCE